MRGLLTVLVAAAAVGLGALYSGRGGGALQDPEEEALALHPVLLQLQDGGDAAVARLAAALACATVGSEGAPNHVPDAAPFERLHAHLAASYPSVYAKLHAERVSQHSLLLEWRGSDPLLRPILLMSHLDVVPAPTGGAGANWTHPPFSGAVADGYVWGRGALDIKVTVVQLLEAVAELLARGHQPRRTILLAFGHDEELGGEYGAKAIAALLAERGVRLELVVDEGGLVVVDGLKTPSLTLVEQPLALVGTAEKGLETWEVEVTGSAGHSSMPPTDGSCVAARLARIVAALEASPAPTRLAPPVTDWLRALAPGVRRAPIRGLLQSADSWLLNPVIGQLLGQAGRELSAFVRTTCAVVGMQAGGIAHNVLPASGTLTLNFRLLPGQESSFIHDYLAMVLHKEPREHVQFRALPGGSPASPVAPAGGPHFQLLKRAILETLAPALPARLRIAPYLLAGMTDSRHYIPLTEGGRVYRFAPHQYNRSAGDIDRVHGVDERISVADYLRGIGFYVRLMELASTDESGTGAAAAA